MNWSKIKDALHLHRFTPSDIPTGVLAVLGLIVLIIAFKTGKALAKVLFVVVALALLGCAVWWQLQNR